VYKQIGVDGNAIVDRYRERCVVVSAATLRTVAFSVTCPADRRIFLYHLAPQVSFLKRRKREREREAIKSRSRTTPWLLSLNNSAGVVRESFAGFVAQPRAILSMLTEKASGT